MNTLLHELSEKIDAYEERLKYALEAAGVGIWEWNIIEDKLSWDNQMLYIFDISAEYFKDNIDFFKSRVHAEDAPVISEKVQQALNTGNNLACTYRVKDSTGNYRVVTSKAKVLYNANDEPIKLVGVSYLESECPRYLFCEVRKALPEHPELLHANFQPVV